MSITDIHWICEHFVAKNALVECRPITGNNFAFSWPFVCFQDMNLEAKVFLCGKGFFKGCIEFDIIIWFRPRVHKYCTKPFNNACRSSLKNWDWGLLTNTFYFYVVSYWNSVVNVICIIKLRDLQGYLGLKRWSNTWDSPHFFSLLKFQNGLKTTQR